MNKQLKFRNGMLVGRGIQWTDYTHNILRGCFHRCRWTMPDGSIARCYAEDVAAGVAQAFYPNGFEHHYMEPGALEAFGNQPRPARIFIDSMSDMFGAHVPEADTLAVLTAGAAAPWHTYQSLTKAPKRLTRFHSAIPTCVHVGVSSPPDSMLGHPLTRDQQERMLHGTLETLATFTSHTTWISFEPLSWDVAPIVQQYPGALKWAVIGAATNGAKVYQPDPRHVEALIDVLDSHRVPVFFKGNIDGNPATPRSTWRELFPNYEPSPWQAAIRAGALDPHTPSRTPISLADAERYNQAAHDAAAGWDLTSTGQYTFI